MHALTPYIHLLQNYIGVRLQHRAHCTTTPVLPCTIYMLAVDTTNNVSVKGSAVSVAYMHRSSYTPQAVKQSAAALSL